MKSFLLIFLSVISLLICSAQDEFAIKAGANLTNARFKSGGSQSLKFGYHAGVAAQLDFSDEIVIRPELTYSNKGYKFPASGVNDGGSLHLNYINFALLGGYRPDDEFVILVGPEFGYLLKANSRFESKNHDLTTTFKKFDVGIMIGVIYWLNKSFSAQATYSNGILPLYNGIRTDPFGNIMGTYKDGYNRSLQIGLQYILKSNED